LLSLEQDHARKITKNNKNQNINYQQITSPLNKLNKLPKIMPGKSPRSCQENHARNKIMPGKSPKITKKSRLHSITTKSPKIINKSPKSTKSRLHSITTKSQKIINKSPKSTNHVGAGWVCPDEGLLLRLVVEAEEKPGPVQLDLEDCRGDGG
jgi:hypothetical protein